MEILELVRERAARRHGPSDVPLSDVSELVRVFDGAQCRLLIFGYDGTYVRAPYGQ